MSKNALNIVPLVAIVIGLVSWLVGERIATEVAVQQFFWSIAGLALVVLAAASFRSRMILPAKDKIYGNAYLWTTLAFALGGGSYILHATKGTGPDGHPWWLILSAAFTFGGVVSSVFLELNRPAMKKAGSIDRIRITEGLRLTAALVLGLSACVFFTYASKERDFRRDLSIGGTFAPSDSTINTVRSLDKDVEVILFFEDKAPALNVVRDYFDGLAAAGVKVRRVDAAFELKLAEEAKVTENGTVVVKAGERSEKWLLGNKPEAVRKKLSRLDDEIRKRIAKLAGDPPILYFTVGHLERPHKKSKRGERAGGDVFRKLVESVNARVRTLGIAQGLAEEVPKDADVVVVFGPQRPFLPAETAALTRYVEGGGSVFLLLDPGVEHGLETLLQTLSVSTPGVMLSNEREFVRETDGPSDHAYIFASSFGTHKAASSLKNARGRVVLLFRQAGEVRDAKTGTAKVSSLAKGRPSTFGDVDRDFKYTEGVDERAAIRELAMASEKDGGGRAIIVADSDVAADGIVTNDANAAFVYQSALWLMRDDDALGGEPKKQKGAKVKQTNDESKFWFYLSVVIVPGLILLAGILVALRRRKRGQR